MWPLNTELHAACNATVPSVALQVSHASNLASANLGTCSINLKANLCQKSFI